MSGFTQRQQQPIECKNDEVLDILQQTTTHLILYRVDREIEAVKKTGKEVGKESKAFVKVQGQGKAKPYSCSSSIRKRRTREDEYS